MSAFDFHGLNEHANHTVHVNQYIDKERGGQVVNVAVECEDCNMILLDFDNPDYDDRQNIVLTPIPEVLVPIGEEVHDRDTAPWGEDPSYSRDDWSLDARNGDTNLGYWDWVEHRQEFDKEDNERMGQDS
jgi:hypothetical protein